MEAYFIDLNRTIRCNNLSTTKFVYNNAWQASIIVSSFEVLFKYHLQLSFENNRDLRSKSQIVDENITALRNLIKEL